MILFSYLFIFFVIWLLEITGHLNVEEARNSTFFNSMILLSLASVMVLSEVMSWPVIVAAAATEPINVYVINAVAGQDLTTTIVREFVIINEMGGFKEPFDITHYNQELIRNVGYMGAEPIIKEVQIPLKNIIEQVVEKNVPVPVAVQPGLVDVNPKNEIVMKQIFEEMQEEITPVSIQPGLVDVQDAYGYIFTVKDQLLAVNNPQHVDIIISISKQLSAQIHSPVKLVNMMHKYIMYLGYSDSGAQVILNDMIDNGMIFKNL